MTELHGLADVQPLAGAALPQVVRETPAAILLVDLAERRVVYANGLAHQLAPRSPLPADVDDWSRDAGLLTEDGGRLEDSPTPLHRVAAGEPVMGEAVTAARGSDTTSAREGLWVVGVPLTDAPPPLARQALVVFLPLREHAAVAELQESGDLRHRAVVASDLSFTISDPHAPDDPLVWVNPAFEHATGYASGDVLGTNCRFLQGPGTDRRAVDRISEALRRDEPITEVLLNYRKDGTAFWNEVVISPVFDAEGRLTHRVGVQSDVTARVEAAAERDRALALARAANARLETLSRISSVLSSRLDSAEALAALPALLVPDLADWAFVVGADAPGRVTSLHVAPGDPARAEDAAVLQEVSLGDLERVDVLREVLSGASVELRSVALTRNDVDSALDGSAEGVAMRRLGTGHLVVVPLRARGRTTAALALVTTDEAGWSAEDLATVADVGVRAGLAIDNARLYEREHAAAVTLQRSLLPELPELDGFDVAARYLPASVGAEVGGDWYDVLDLPGPGVGVAIGDVMGHDLRAASAMGQLRSVLRSYAWSGDEPGAVLEQLDLLVRGLGMAGLATCVYARITPDEATGGCRVTYAKAGHPAPLLLGPGGDVQRLDQALTTPIGVAALAGPVEQASVPMPAGASLVLYTDGLLERRDRPLREGLAEMEQALAGAPRGATAAQLRDLLLQRFTPDEEGLDDDTCVLVVRRAAG